MKFLLDMGISPEVEVFLDSLGLEVLHVREVGEGRLPDHEILAKARDEGWILVTHDLDFTELVAEAGGRLPSVILFRLRDMRPKSVIRHLERVLDQAHAAIERGAFVAVRETAIRVRALPIR